KSAFKRFPLLRKAPLLRLGRGERLDIFADILSSLLLLSPGIPEYLSGSSPVAALVINPGQFVFQIVANVGLYGPGALLVRAATVRWRKGWATVLLLGASYSILEERVPR